jgi:hypothetical protein
VPGAGFSERRWHVVDNELGLAEAIDLVRSELVKAQDGGRGADLRFAVGPVEMEFVVEVVKKASGEAAIKVLNVLSLGGGGEVSRGEANRIKVVLNPIGKDGAPFEVAASSVRRPDAVS